MAPLSGSRTKRPPGTRRPGRGIHQVAGQILVTDQGAGGRRSRSGRSLRVRHDPWYSTVPLWYDPGALGKCDVRPRSGGRGPRSR